MSQMVFWLLTFCFDRFFLLKRYLIPEGFPSSNIKLIIFITFNKLIHLIKPINFSDYNFLQINSLVSLSDSGTISEESSLLKFRAINLRDSHERPEAMEEAAVMLSGLNSNRIINALEILKNQEYGQESRTLNLVEDYSKKNVSEKILRILISYTDYVKRVVWKETTN